MPTATAFSNDANNFGSTLAADYAIGSGEVELVSGAVAALVAKVGALSASNWVRFTLIESGAIDDYGNVTDPTLLTIFKATGTSGAKLTGVVAIEGTTDRVYHTGDRLECWITDGTIADIKAAVNTIETTMVDTSSPQTIGGSKYFSAPVSFVGSGIAFGAGHDYGNLGALGNTTVTLYDGANGATIFNIEYPTAYFDVRFSTVSAFKVSPSLATVSVGAEFKGTTNKFGASGTLQLTDTGGGNFNLNGVNVIALDVDQTWFRNASHTGMTMRLENVAGRVIVGAAGNVGTLAGQFEVTTPDSSTPIFVGYNYFDVPAFTVSANGTVTATGGATFNGQVITEYSAATNGTPSNGVFARIGTDGTLGPLGIALGGVPSATGSSRYGFINVGDAGALRPLVLNTNGYGFGYALVGAYYPGSLAGIFEVTGGPTGNIIGVYANDGTPVVSVAPDGTITSNGNVVGAGQVYLGMAPSGIYGDGSNIAVRTYNFSYSDIYFQSYSGGRTLGIFKNEGQFYVGATIAGSLDAWTELHTPDGTTPILAGYDYFQNPVFIVGAFGEITTSSHVGMGNNCYLQLKNSSGTYAAFVYLDGSNVLRFQNSVGNGTTRHTIDGAGASWIVSLQGGADLFTITGAAYFKCGANGSAVADGFEVSSSTNSQIVATGTGFPSVKAYSTTNDVITKMQSAGSSSVGLCGTETNHNLWILTNNTARIRVDADGMVNVLGGMKNPIRAITTTDSILASDEAIFADATGGAFTMTLPDASTIGNGKTYHVKKVDATANVATIACDGAQTIDGAPTFDLTSSGQVVTIKSFGGQWFVF